MSVSYRVVDVGSNVIESEHRIVIGVNSAEAAAKSALGVSLFRSGSKADLRARVYYQSPGQPMTMVRLYTKAIDRSS